MVSAKFREPHTYYYCILPGDNAAEFPELDRELARRGCKAHFTRLFGGSRIYRIHHSDLEKLPRDVWKDSSGKGTGDPYLGSDDSGHGIYPLTPKALLHLTQIAQSPEALVRRAQAVEIRWQEVAK